MKKENKVSTNHIGILGNMDATEIAEKIRSKEITAQEVIDCVQERAEIAEPKINAIVASNYDIASNNIKTKGVFAGVPMFIKDLADVKGFPTRHGSIGIPDNPAKKTEKFVKQIESTGCIVVGKSATSEFGLLPCTETTVNGDTRNPINIEYSTGGSSGGAAALVAAGVVPIAHAADGGGSIRIPASCCGLIGLKPSRGRHVGSPTAKMPVDIVTQGIVSESVRDTANYFSAIEQFHATKKMPKIGSVQAASKKRLKIAMFTQTPAGIESHPEVVRSVLATGKKCETLGHHVDYINNPYDDMVLLDFLVYYSFLANMIKTFGRLTYNKRFQANQVEKFTDELGGHFTKIMLMAPISFRRLRNDVVHTYIALFEKYDVLLTPTLSAPVPKLGHFGPNEPFLSVVMRLNNYVNFTIVQNATGAPAISLPMGKCDNGLPIGSMFATKIGDERVLLELAFELEETKSFMSI